MEIFDAITNLGLELGRQPAIIDDEETLAWHRLPELVDRLCLGLVHNGLRRGKGVALLCRRTRHLPLAMLAVMRGGGVAVPMAAHAGDEDLPHMARASNPTLLIYDPARAAEADRLKREIEFRAVVRIGEGAGKGEVAWAELERTGISGSRFPVLSPDTVVLHNYGLDAEDSLCAGMGQLGQLWALAGLVNRAMKVHLGDRFLDLFPPGINAHESLLRALHTSGTLVLTADDNPTGVISAVERAQVNVLTAPATAYRGLCRHLAEAGDRLGSLRLLEARGHVPRPLQDLLKQTCNRELLATWGNPLTLGPALATLPSGFGAPASPLQALPGMRAMIIDSAGKAMAGDGVGELCLGCSHLPLKAMTANGKHRLAVDDQGRLPTGLLARRRDAGEIRLLGCRFDVVLREGKRVYVHLIADALEQLPGVCGAEAVVIPHGAGEFQVVVGLLPTPGNASPPQASQCMQFLWERLRPHEMPDDVAVLADLPLLPNREPDRRALGRLLRARMEQTR